VTLALSMNSCMFKLAIPDSILCSMDFEWRALAMHFTMLPPPGYSFLRLFSISPPALSGPSRATTKKFGNRGDGSEGREGLEERS
jgi:hypothetical protein